MARGVVPRAGDHVASRSDSPAPVDAEVSADARWLVRRVENGRFELLDPGAPVDQAPTATLSVAPTRDGGDVAPRAGEVWQIARDDRAFAFRGASGGVVAVATKPSIVRERFEVDLPVLGRQLTVQPVRPWWRRWQIEDRRGAVGTVERRGLWPQRHELRFPHPAAGSDELALVIGWLVALVCTDPPRGWRSASDRQRQR